MKRKKWHFLHLFFRRSPKIRDYCTIFSAEVQESEIIAPIFPRGSKNPRLLRRFFHEGPRIRDYCTDFSAEVQESEIIAPIFPRGSKNPRLLHRFFHGGPRIRDYCTDFSAEVQESEIIAPIFPRRSKKACRFSFIIKKKRQAVCSQIVFSYSFTGACSKLATRNSQNLVTEGMLHFSFGVCGERGVGPNETMSKPGTASAITAHSSPA